MLLSFLLLNSRYYGFEGFFFRMYEEESTSCYLKKRSSWGGLFIVPFYFPSRVRSCHFILPLFYSGTPSHNEIRSPTSEKTQYLRKLLNYFRCLRERRLLYVWGFKSYMSKTFVVSVGTGLGNSQMSWSSRILETNLRRADRYRVISVGFCDW